MFRHKKLLSLALAITLVLGLVAAGCSSAKTASNVSNDYGGIRETTAAAMPAAEMVDQSFAKSGQAGTGSGSGSGDAQNTLRKIVRNASLGMEVVDVSAAYDQLLAYAKARKGYETMRNEYRGENYLTVNATLKIDPAELDNFIAFAETVGKVINCQISTDDITESYYDATTRLETMEKSLAKYDEFLTRAETIEEVLAVQNQINQITVEIESLKGRLRLWDSMLVESTISIEIRQVDDPVKIKKEITWSALSWADMVYLMRSGLTRLANGFVTVFQWLLVALVASAPVWLILLIVLIVWRRRRHNKKPQPPKPGPQKLDQTEPDIKPDSQNKT